ncbi:AAA-like domain-containing protein [Anaerosporobacter sp.]|uniref:AAA-like domain-containing protein n=1 Tax=Anaerosporobacter sp. TaxID=1872529 RepID=UPI00286F6EB1|nr:AAA-like domain-containing protein [Anaerosporobacter sp.]
MAKVFNVTGDCKPEKHYMVNIDERLLKIRELVDDGKYFTINRARQYGKTTTLRALNQSLQKNYYVVLMDFQTFGNAKFKNENIFSITFSKIFLRGLKRNTLSHHKEFETSICQLDNIEKEKQKTFELTELFEELSAICSTSDKPIVLMIDEVDSATNNLVFLDFLAQLRAYYIDRDVQPTFHSVILAGVYDIKNLNRKFRSDDEHKTNSPWNIATDFDVNMSLTKEGIARMLEEYEADYHTTMNIDEIATLLYDYTSGYPFLVSRLCKLIDEEVGKVTEFHSQDTTWTKNGFNEAVRMILSEKNTLFESLIGKLTSYPELNSMLRSLLFTGKSIVYNSDEPAIDTATMFGFIKNQHGIVAIANRIFETRLYNLYLSTAEMQGQDIYKASLQDKNQLIVDGHLNMCLILEKFVVHFNDLYGDSDKTFVEDEGRKYFLLYLRPIINGTGNYYIESRTRELRRTDVIVDYLGEQFIIEMKIWHGNEYNNRGEKQLVGYLDDYHVNKGYMISFNFNKKKQIGVHEIIVGDKTLIEATV